jgi:hypothetical protein
MHTHDFHRGRFSQTMRVVMLGALVMAGCSGGDDTGA